MIAIRCWILIDFPHPNRPQTRVNRLRILTDVRIILTPTVGSDRIHYALTIGRTRALRTIPTEVLPYVSQQVDLLICAQANITHEDPPAGVARTSPRGAQSVRKECWNRGRTIAANNPQVEHVATRHRMPRTSRLTIRNQAMHTSVGRGHILSFGAQKMVSYKHPQCLIILPTHAAVAMPIFLDYWVL